MTTSSTTRGRIFSHPEDLHGVVFHLLCLVAYGCAFWLYLHPAQAGIRGLPSRVAFVLAAAFMLGWISGIDVGVNFHNHTHRRIFRSALLGRWFGRFWTFSGGWPSFFWHVAHVKVHHANLLGPADWTLPRRRADGSFENIYLYVLAHWPWRYASCLWREFTSGRGSGSKALRELSIFLVLWSLPFWIDPGMALWLWVLPHWIANVIIMGTGMYVQHVGCTRKSADRPFGHSNIFLSRFFNLTMFNIGYHAEHHDHPNVHWSDLPALHERLKPELIQGGAHVVPYGYYHAVRLAGAPIKGARGLEEFRKQHPAYARRATSS